MDPVAMCLPEIPGIGRIVVPRNDDLNMLLQAVLKFTLQNSTDGVALVCTQAIDTRIAEDKNAQHTFCRPGRYLLDVSESRASGNPAHGMAVPLTQHEFVDAWLQVATRSLRVVSDEITVIWQRIIRRG